MIVIMDVKTGISLIVLVLVIQTAQRSSANSESCQKRADVTVVFEVPAGRQAFNNIHSFLVQLFGKLNPSSSCIQLSFIIAWKEVDTILKFNCHNKRQRCFRVGTGKLRSSTRYASTKGYDQNNLVKAINSANTGLLSSQDGSRNGVRKVCLLVLNPGPKNVIPTLKAVNRLHDENVVVIAVGIGEKDPLGEIALYPQYAINVPSIAELSSAPILKQLEHLVIKPYAEFTGAPKSAGLTLMQGQAEPTETPIIRPEDLKDGCKYIVDIGFLVDSSGSLRKQYGKAKVFVRRIATKFNISEAGSHGGLVIFSARNYVKTEIQFDDYTNLYDFNTAVENIPYYGYLTRIDLALDKAHGELFTKKARSRPNVNKVVFLITDGMQNPDSEYGNPIDVAKHAEPLHNRNINIFAVGVGDRINTTELALITKSKDRVYTVKNFDELISDEFVKNVSRELCNRPGKTPEKIVITEALSTTPTTGTGIKQRTLPAPEPCNKKCSSCGCGGDCCKCCNQKPDVFVNVFSGSNSKNYMSQGMKVRQSGNSRAESEVRFPASIGGGGGVTQNTKEMSSKEIAALIKECLPYQKKVNEGIQELIRRSLKTQTNNPNMQINKKR